MDLAASAADLGLWVWEIERDEIWTTDKGRELFGFAKKEPLDFTRFAGRLHPDDREPVSAAVAAAFPNGGDYHAEYRVVSGDTSPRWIAAHGKTEFGTDGQPSRLLNRMVRQRRNWHQYHAQCFLRDRLPLFLHGLRKERPDLRCRAIRPCHGRRRETTHARNNRAQRARQSEILLLLTDHD
jgi:hypothetical protein